MHVECPGRLRRRRCRLCRERVRGVRRLQGEGLAALGAGGRARVRGGSARLLPRRPHLLLPGRRQRGVGRGKQRAAGEQLEEMAAAGVLQSRAHVCRRFGHVGVLEARAARVPVRSRSLECFSIVGQSFSSASTQLERAALRGVLAWTRRPSRAVRWTGRSPGAVHLMSNVRTRNASRTAPSAGSRCRRAGWSGPGRLPASAGPKPPPSDCRSWCGWSG